MEKKYYFESITLENYRLKRKELNQKKKNFCFQSELNWDRNEILPYFK